MHMQSIRHYRDLHAWQEAMTLVTEIYVLTRSFPSEERFELIPQMRRAAVSIPSNIAEGFARKTPNEFRRYLLIARGSLAEPETQMILAVRLNYLQRDAAREPWLQAQRVGRLISGLLRTTET